MGALKAIAMDRELTGESHRVLTYLIGTIGMKNEWSVLNQAEIAKELGIARPHINRSIQTLVRKGLIIKGARIGRGHAYSLNPAYGWRGGLKELADAQAEAPKLSLLRGGRDLHVE
jgi:DNA-binding IclR family transcriptional regulator